MNSCFLLLLSVLLLSSCDGDEPAEQITPANHVYYYFPKANVYFDSTDGVYIFASSDEGKWQTEKLLPDSLQAVLGRRVPLNNTTQPVWKDNEQHRLIYSVALYSTPSDFKQSKKIPATVKQRTDTTAEAEKGSRLDKFFKRIFGNNKKDKKEEEQRTDGKRK